MNTTLALKKHLSPFQIIILGFAGVILLGTILLMLPISSVQRVITPFSQALFTSVSAVCVTGLVVYDTATYWSYFGQLVILILIQIGGMGVITVAVFIAIISGKKISLMQRSTMQEAISAFQMGGIVKMTYFIIKGCFLVEFIGACLMMTVFCNDFGIKGIWMAIFHSISAFCNAGFDIMGSTNNQFASLTVYQGVVWINFVVMLLIVIGGIGFLTWSDILANRNHFHKYRMQSKVIIGTTLILIIIPALYFFIKEFNNMPITERVLSSLFQAITPRTAGFNTVDMNIISSTGRALIIILMLIGGSPGSTAGGMKTTTIAVLFANMMAIARRNEYAYYFGRRIDNSIVRNASTLLFMYLTLFISGAFIISIVENIDMGLCLFETASAIGTVGLSLGITPGLHLISKLVLIALMFFGRVGGLTMIFATGRKVHHIYGKLPQEKITVG